MTCSMNSAQRRWTISCWLSALLVVLLSVAAAMAFLYGHLRGPLSYPVAVLPALPILWVLYETGRYLAAEKDEFLRMLLVQSLLGGAFGTLAVTTIWGYLEDFTHAPRLHLGLVYLIFWLCTGIAFPVVYRRFK